MIVFAYYLGGKLGLTLSLVKESVTPIWPPTGIALASLLLFGYRYTPAILAGALLVNVTTAVPAATLLGIAIGNTLEALTGAFLLNRSGFRKTLEGMQDVLKLVVLGACLSTVVSACIGSASLYFGNVIPPQQIEYAFQVWWLGDMTGAIWVTPIILVLGSRLKAPKPITPEFGLVTILLALSSYFVFTQHFNYTYALFPLILWSSMRFATSGAAVSAMVVSTIAVFMTMTGQGPFLVQSDYETLTLLNLFIGASALTAFLVAAMMNDRRRAQNQLELANQDLEKRVAGRTEVLEKARAEAEQAERRAWFMAESSAVLSSSLDNETTLKALAKTAVPFLADCCLIDVLGRDGKIDRVGAAHKDPEREQFLLQLKAEYVPDEHSRQPAARVMHSRKPHLIKELTDRELSKHVEDAAHFELIRRIGIRSLISVPMISNDVVIGAISLGLIDEERNYDQSDVLLAQEFSKHATLAVQNSRLYQELQDANRFKDEFLATVSHELRTPLTVILGWAKILEQMHETITPEMKRKALLTIARSAEMQAQIVEDLLDVSRIRTGKFSLQLTSFSLRQVLNNAVDAIRPAAFAKSIDVQVELDPKLDRFYGDPDRLQQAFWNLLSNAVKFTPDGGKIQITSARRNRHIELGFTDTGKGISAGFLPYIFQRFRQADSSFTRKHGGLGLGLSLVKHFVELHGGSVSVKSEGEGKGATFVIRLPQRDTADVTEKLATNARFTEQTMQKMKILVVDDDPDTIELLVHVIEQAGCQVRSAGAARQAMDLLKDWKPDLLISDIAMPEEDGYAFIKKVRALEDEQLNSIPAIALTAYATTEDQIKATSSGYHLHMRKPVQPNELVRMIENLTGLTS